MRLAGKVAVITGAARGVGAAISKAFVREGAHIVAVDVLDATLKEMVAGAHSEGSMIALVADVSTPEGNQQAVTCALEKYGGLDCFVANAAIQRFGTLAETLPTTWDEVHSVNLRGAFLGAQTAIPVMSERGGGSLIFTASVLGIVGDGTTLI